MAAEFDRRGREGRSGWLGKRARDCDRGGERSQWDGRQSSKATDHAVLFNNRRRCSVVGIHFDCHLCLSHFAAFRSPIFIAASHRIRAPADKPPETAGTFAEIITCQKGDRFPMLSVDPRVRCDAALVLSSRVRCAAARWPPVTIPCSTGARRPLQLTDQSSLTYCRLELTTRGDDGR